MSRNQMITPYQAGLGGSEATKKDLCGGWKSPHLVKYNLCGLEHGTTEEQHVDRGEFLGW